MVKKIFWLIILGALFLIPAISFSSTIQLSQTGQTKCYNTVGTEIPCAGTGQDGEIQAGVEWPKPRFTVSYCDANGPCSNQDSDCDDNSSTDVVVDNLTGLVWARNRNLTNGPITWYQAIDYSNNLNLCGYSDWRLLNVNELESLVNADEEDMAAWLYAEGFTSAQSCGYWSSTTVAGTTDAAWTYIENGPVLAAAKDYSSFYVWPVRAGQCGLDNSVICLPRTGQTASYATGDDGDLQKGVVWPNPRFSDNENGTVTDNLTGLIWTKNANAPGPSVCNPGTLKTWQGALNYVACLNTNIYLGYDDWRLPNRKELRSLNDYSSQDPALQLGHPFTSVQSSYYWSSTSYANYANTSNAWDVFMWRGDEYYHGKDADSHVWPVRAGQVGSFGNLKIVPTSYNFGSVDIGSSSTPQTFTISNTGLADLHISEMTLTDTSNYSLNVNGGSSPCGSTTPTITPDSSCTVTVTFSPSSKGIKNANLTIDSDDPDTPILDVSLSGTGIPLVECSLVPDWPIVVQGGTLGFQGIATNNTDEVQVFKYATRITLPSGNKYPYAGYLLGPIEVTLNPHQTKSKHLSQHIPSYAPLGTYTYHGYVGNYGVGIYDECTFNFTVNSQGQGCNLCHQ